MSKYLKTVIKTDDEVEYVKTDYSDGIRGFNRLDVDHMGVPSYVEATRIFTLTPDNTYFEFFAGGVKYTKTTAQSIVWPDVSGVYYFYFDTSGVLQYILNTDITEAIFLKSALCGLVSWNSVTQLAIIQAVDEQHGVDGSGGMSSSTHFNLHMCDGAKWSRGGDITGLVDSTDVYVSVDAMVSFDEDIPLMTLATTSHPFIYRSGADNGWVETVDSLRVGYKNGAETNISWNENVGGVWQLTESDTATDYIIHYMVWTNDANSPIKKIIGQQAYASRTVAREALYKELGEIKMTGLPSTEIHFLYAWIVYRSGTVEDDGDGNAYIDMRINN